MKEKGEGCVFSLSLRQGEEKIGENRSANILGGRAQSAFSGGILTSDVTYTHSCAPSERMRPYVQFHRPPDRIWINLRDTSTKSVIGIRGASGPLAAPAFVLRASRVVPNVVLGIPSSRAGTTGRGGRARGGTIWRQRRLSSRSRAAHPQEAAPLARGRVRAPA